MRQSARISTRRAGAPTKAKPSISIIKVTTFSNADARISGEYQLEIQLKGLRLPVTITLPDIPDTPPSEGQFDPSPSLIVTDKETGFEETGALHIDPLDTVHLESDEPNLPHVSTCLLCSRTTGQRVGLEPGC
jgi:hypothetical protein